METQRDTQRHSGVCARMFISQNIETELIITNIQYGFDGAPNLCGTNAR